MDEQYNQLINDCPAGIYLLPTESKTRYEGVYFIQGGLYAEAVLWFRIESMQLYFKTFVAHPLIHPLTLKLYHPDFDTLVELLRYTSQILEIDSLDAFGEDVNEWRQKIVKCVKESQQYIYDEPDSLIQFQPWDLETHQKAWEELVNKES